jgi:CHAD domain-containing protein
MKAGVEREVKLRPGPRFSEIDLPGRDLPKRVLSSTYFDTDDLRLAAGSITLRRRMPEGGDTAVWQLKLGRGQDRLELEWDAPDERVPDEVARLVLAHTRARPLSAVATLRTERSGVLVHAKGVDVAEVVVDAVDVLSDGETVTSFEEIEAELVDGGGRDLRRLERRLRRAGAVDPDGRPKLLQALDLPAPARPASPGKRPADQLAAALRTAYREVLDHDPGTRLGLDPDELHDHRVAIRRLRALLRAGMPYLDRPWANGLRDSLRPAGRALADVRDLDVLVADLGHQAASLAEPERAGSTDVLDRLRERRDRARAQLADTLSEGWYVSLLNRLETAVAAPKLKSDGSVVKIVRKEHRRARRRVRAASRHPTDARLHEARKAVKRARYAAEFAASAGTSGMHGYVKRAKAVQDALGEHQDAVVATRVLAEIDGELHRPMAHMAVAALIDVQQRRKDAARSAFSKTWRRLDRRARAIA